MQRVLEPEYMDTVQEAESYAAMDHAAVNSAVAGRFVELGAPGCRRIVDLGCGPGDIPLLLAERCPDATIVGVDAAATMLALARPKAERAGLGGRVTFEQADVKALPFADGAFDGVFSNTILHHIPDPVEFLREAARVLAPGGVLLVRDLYRPATLAEAEALVALHAAAAPPDQQQLLLQSLCAALTLDEARAAADRAGLGHARVAMSSDRHYSIEIGR
ncbi:MAG: class I SAM-dependent methyltransferase [Planctomycetota bacterium]